MRPLKGQSLLKNRISLRLATAAGTAALTVAGATFGFSAFAADTGAAPDQAASAAILPDEADTESFFPDDSQGVPAGQLEQASTEREQALAQSLATASGTLEEEKEEEEAGQYPSGGDPRRSPGMLPLRLGIDRSVPDSMGAGAAGPQPHPCSGAYGIRRRCPAENGQRRIRLATPATQIKWGLGYIKDRYGSPCAAWEHSQSVGWY